MFMNAAPATDDRTKDPAQRDPERGRLLDLVRALIDFGRDLMAAMQERNTTAAPPLALALRFGSLNVALIIARITRGIMLAEALEARLLRPAPPMGARTGAPAPTRTVRATRTPPRPRPDEDAELLGGLPSAKDIAARIRNQRTGAVIVDICRDLGITTQHPLWREINDAIRHHGGNLATWLRNVIRSHSTPDSLALCEAMAQAQAPYPEPPVAARARPP